MTECTPAKETIATPDASRTPSSWLPKLLQTPRQTPETDASTPVEDWKTPSLETFEEKLTFSETSCSSTTLSQEDSANNTKTPLITTRSNRALFQDSPENLDQDADYSVPQCPLPQRPLRVESCPSRSRNNSRRRSSQRHPSNLLLRSRRSGNRSSFYSSDEDEQVSRRRSLTRRRRRSIQEDNCKSHLLRFSQSRSFLWLLTVLGLTSVSVTFLTGQSLMASDLEQPKHIAVLFRQLEEGEHALETVATPPALHVSAGLRGNMLHDVVVKMEHETTPRSSDKDRKENNKDKKHHHKSDGSNTDSRRVDVNMISGVAVPAKKLRSVKPLTAEQDERFYPEDASASDESQRRVIVLDGSPPQRHYELDLYPSPFTDNTQFYSVFDSSDERLSTMELREPLSDGECVPMQDWQTTFYPSCNSMHEMDMTSMGEKKGDYFNLFGTKGYWRNAWRVDSIAGHSEKHANDTIVLKTLKINHRFEEAHFEHDRVDAVAMERLTASPHVINIFGYCGHSVVTEYADGKRLGALADKSRKKPLARLRIARNIAEGLADLHGIDGEGNATFVHLDVNPANVVSVNGTLKLNDFNIGILRRWNTTSKEPCGFPAQYPNPQWRSPEEARNEQHLTEKVDVFSMGHIFFRLICGHEPWHKLEPGGRPSKEVVSQKVIDGVLPFIPEEIKFSTDPEIVAIREAMLSCYTYDPKQRPSAREITNLLQTALENLERMAEA